jgi:hypothetical protein
MEYAPAALFLTLFRAYFSSQVHGAIRRALLAKANTDMDRYDLISIATVLLSINMPVRVCIHETPIKLCLFQVDARLHFSRPSLHLCFGFYRPSA